jgi:hypothetical protein
MFVSAWYNFFGLNRGIPACLASFRPVEGSICINPRALALDRAFSSNADSCRIKPRTRLGSISSFAACWEMISQWRTGKKMSQISEGNDAMERLL